MGWEKFIFIHQGLGKFFHLCNQLNTACECMCTGTSVSLIVNKTVYFAESHSDIDSDIDTTLHTEEVCMYV